MKVVVWVIVGIFALNILFVGVPFVFGGVRRRRSERSQRRLEAVWNIPTLPTAAATRRSRSRRFTGVVLVATFALAAFGLSDLRSGGAVPSALSALVPWIHDSSELARSGADHPVGDREAAQGDEASSTGSQAGPVGSTDPSVPSSSTATTAGELGAPTTVAAIPASSSVIRLAWTHVGRAKGYEIDRSIDGVGWSAIAHTGQGVTTYVDDGLSSGTTYYYRVLAVTDAGDVAASDVISATTATEPLSTTTVTSAATSSTAIDLTWVDVDGETGYRIERSPDGASGWTTIATTGQDVTTYTDAGLSAATTYFYRVFTVNAGGESPPSDVTSATTAPEQAPGTTAPVGTTTTDATTADATTADATTADATTADATTADATTAATAVESGSTTQPAP